jgi:hypothetical protein
MGKRITLLIIGGAFILALGACCGNGEIEREKIHRNIQEYNY